MWDKPKQASNFALVAEDLSKMDLVSAYHEKMAVNFGEEAEPTLIWRKNMSEVYHIDYCFISTDWVPSLKEVSVGGPRQWLDFSDHVPLVMDAEL